MARLARLSQVSVAVWMLQHALALEVNKDRLSLSLEVIQVILQRSNLGK